MIWQSDRLDYFADDCFSGMQLAYPERFRKGYIQKNSGVIMKKELSQEGFALIISGGAGNGPLWHGYVGDGLADAAVVGGPYSAPNAYAIYEAGKFLGKDKGVLLFYNNFAGDYLNNDMAEELLHLDGIEVESVVCKDDIASAIGEDKKNRGGRAGAAIMIKLAAIYKKNNYALKDAANLLRNKIDRVGTLSIHVDNEMKTISYGKGFSGEPAIKEATHMDMELSAKETLEILLDDLKPKKEEKLFLLINRLRLTSYSDAYIYANLLHKELSKNFEVPEVRVGAFSNIADTYGFDVSVFCMDDETSKLMHEKVYTDNFIL